MDMLNKDFADKTTEADRANLTDVRMDDPDYVRFRNVGVARLV